jgi:hypothetical protein
MRNFLYVISVVSIIGLAFWAYRENHLTQLSMSEVSRLDREIAALHEAISVQRAEWAYLNRPQRLRELAELNFERLGLQSMAPEQFGDIDQIAYPERVVEPVLQASAEEYVLIGGIIEVLGAIENVQGELTDVFDTAQEQNP